MHTEGVSHTQTHLGPPQSEGILDRHNLVLPIGLGYHLEMVLGELREELNQQVDSRPLGRPRPHHRWELGLRG